ncbi:restriction endonuclease [Nitrospirota bacterium]
MTRSRKIRILKKSGLEEAFDSSKMYDSLINTGASADAVREVIRLIEREIRPGMSTRRIYRLAKKHLRQIDRPSGMRYSLKDSIYALGPSGFPFEKYIASIFRLKGYRTKVGQIVKGQCVTHEVDVIATSDKEQIMMECKFHRNGNKHSDVKIAMYVDSRFRDIAKSLRAQPSPTVKFSGALVTNTRLTSEAIKYAECTGLRAIAWKYPRAGGLEQLIETTGAYPVTMLPCATRAVIEKLTSKAIVLARDINSLSASKLSRRTGIDLKIAERLKAQCSDIL